MHNAYVHNILYVLGEVFKVWGLTFRVLGFYRIVFRISLATVMVTMMAKTTTTTSTAMATRCFNVLGLGGQGFNDDNDGRYR